MEPQQPNQDQFLRQIIHEELLKLGMRGDGQAGAPAGGGLQTMPGAAAAAGDGTAFGTALPTQGSRGLDTAGAGTLRQAAPGVMLVQPNPPAGQAASPAAGAPANSSTALLNRLAAPAARQTRADLAGAFIDIHAQLSQAMAVSLQKLRAVLEEVEQVARRMEEVLAQEEQAGLGHRYERDSSADENRRDSGQEQGLFGLGRAVQRGGRQRRGQK